MHPAPMAPTAGVPLCHQLPLPLDPGDAAGLAQPNGAETERSLEPAALWVGLSPPLRAQIRQTFHRVCEELIHDGHHR